MGSILCYLHLEPTACLPIGISCYTKVWSSGIKSPIAEKKGEHYTTITFWFTERSLYLSADASEKNRKLHSKNKYHG